MRLNVEGLVAQLRQPGIVVGNVGEAVALARKADIAIERRRELEGELLREVGEGLGVSCERVRQLQGEAVKRLRGSYRLLSPGAPR